jgi:hypothetical protein
MKNEFTVFERYADLEEYTHMLRLELLSLQGEAFVQKRKELDRRESEKETMEMIISRLFRSHKPSA